IGKYPVPPSPLTNRGPTPRSRDCSPTVHNPSAPVFAESNTALTPRVGRSPMQEVAIPVVLGHLDVFSHVVPLTPDLFDGLPWTEQELRATKGRIDWDP